MFNYDEKAWITINDILDELKKKPLFNLDIKKCGMYIRSSLFRPLMDESLKIVVPLHVCRESLVKASYVCNTHMVAFNVDSVLKHLSHYSSRVASSYSRYGLKEEDKRLIINFIIKFCKSKKLVKNLKDDITILGYTKELTASKKGSK